MGVYRVAAAVAVVAYCFSDVLVPAVLDESLVGKVAVVTGGSRGSGRGFAQGLSEAGATVYITGRSEAALKEACESVPGPGKCIARVVDSANDASLEAFFSEVGAETGGQLDILVNNAYAGIGWWGKRNMLGKPFWEQGIELYDAVHNVGVRSHYKATLLALPMLRKAKSRGLIVNTNSLGCLLYAINVPYGIGKCAVDKMSSTMAIELVTEGIDVVSWWAKEPMQTDEIKAGNVDGTTWRRGQLPGIAAIAPRLDDLYHSALAGTLFYEGRTLAAFARDHGRAVYSGTAVQTGHLARKYGVVDERGLRSPSFMSIKSVLFLFIPQLRTFADIPKPPPCIRGFVETGECPDNPNLRTATPAQKFVFNILPDIPIPLWIPKIIQGNPVTFQWPLL
eukprot:gene3533-10120_t